MEIVSDQLLIATGRIPNSDTLDLDKIGSKNESKKGLLRLMKN